MMRILQALETLEAIRNPDIKELKSAIPLSLTRVRELVRQAVAEGMVIGIPDEDDTIRHSLTEKGKAALRAFLTQTKPPAEEPDAEEPDAEEPDAEEIPVALEEPVEEPAPKAKDKRVILNPQPVIDKKTALLAAAGFDLTYAAREWTIRNRETDYCFILSSREFSEVKVADMVDFAIMVTTPSDQAETQATDQAETQATDQAETQATD